MVLSKKKFAKHLFQVELKKTKQKKSIYCSKKKIKNTTAPSGCHSPVVTPISQSELRISWLPPDYPNGDVINYNVVVDDDVTIDVGLEQSHVLDELQPYKLERRLFSLLTFCLL